MADLHRAMGGKQVIAHVRLQFAGNQSAGGGDEPVDHHRDALGGAAENQAGDAADLETADLGQNVDRVVGVGTVERQGAPDHGDFVRQGRIVDAGAAMRDPDRVKTGNGRNDGCRRGGVGYPHIAGADEVHPLLSTFCRQADAELQAADSFLTAHGRPGRQVGRAAPDLAVNQAIQRAEIVIDPHIDHRHPGAGMARQRIDRRAAFEKVVDHLHGHLPREGADPFSGDAVIAGKGEDPLAVEGVATGGGHVAASNLLQAAERPLRFGLAVNPCLDLGQTFRVDRPDASQGRLQFVRGHDRYLFLAH